MPDFVARPTSYAGVRFRSRLEATWAAFFDQLGWRWRYEPVDFANWVPDFEVTFDCSHSECPRYHWFYAECKPHRTLGQFDGHPSAAHLYGRTHGSDGAMLLGVDYTVASAEFVHGHGAAIWLGEDLFRNWSRIADVSAAWQEAANRMQRRPRGDGSR